MMNDRMRVVIFGLGVMGRNHLRNLRQMNEVVIVGVCDPIVRSDEVGIDVFANVEQVLEEVQFDAAVVCVPTTAHAEIGIALARAGKHMLMEKPLAATVDEGILLREEVDRTGVRLAVGHIERFNPAVIALRDAITANSLFSLAITRVGPIPPRIADVGVLVDLSVHDIDLIRFLTGKEIVDAHIFKSKKIHDKHEDNAILSFKLEDEVVATITTNWLTPFKKRTIEVATHESYFEADLMRQQLTEFSSYKLDNSFITRVRPVRPAEPLRSELEAFQDLVLRGERRQLASVEDGLRTLEVLQGKEAYE